MARDPTLEIIGHRGERVPNRFVAGGESERLAILLPGYGYTCDMPLFYYAENLLTDRAFDVLRVEYAYSQRDDFGDVREAETRAWLRADAVAAGRAGLAAGDYREVVLVGKSLGTLAIGECLDDFANSGPTFRVVWLTPLLFDPGLSRQVARWAPPSLFVVGDDEPAHQPGQLAAAAEITAGRVIVVDRADHGLDVPGDPVASAGELARIVRGMAEFLGA